MSTEYESVTIKQTRGPRLKFSGHLLAEEEFTTRGRNETSMIMQIWQTEGGALVAVSDSQPTSGGFADVRAEVVEPVKFAMADLEKMSAEEIDATKQRAAQAMHFAVLDFFGWDRRAINMAKGLGWSLTREVA